MNAALITVAGVNALDLRTFVERFGDVAEHSPWVAEVAAGSRPFESREVLIDAFGRAVENASSEAQLNLLRAHPDLAGRASLANELGGDSCREQAGAGLDQLTASELERFTALNARYGRRFGFPFVFAVKGVTKAQIFEAFEDRIGNSLAEERQTALDNVRRILRFRLEERVAA